MSCTSKIRPAEEADTPALLAMASGMHAEGGRYSRYPIDPSRLTELVSMLRTRDEGCVFVVETRGIIVGMLWGVLSEMYFAQVRTANDVLWYILPEHRIGWNAVKLVRAFEHWAEAHGAVEVHLGVSVGIDNAHAVRFAELLGYTQTGWVLTKYVR